MANLDRRPEQFDELVQDFTRKMDRQWVLDMLRDKHGLSLHEAAGRDPAEIQRRQAVYEDDLAELKKKWEAEDAQDRNKA